MLKLHREPSGLQATVAGLSFPGGSTIGRFTAVMPGRGTSPSAAWSSTRPGGPTGPAAEESSAESTTSPERTPSTRSPRPHRCSPVTLAVNARPHLPAGQVLTLADVHLGYADGRVRAVLADGAPVSLRQLNMATTVASARAIRLLREISDAGTRVPFWSWGEAEAILNHFPAVRYRGVTLAEQRWRYPATAERSRNALRDWIAETGVSRYVLVGARDTRLHLDTRHPAHLDLLLDEITNGDRWVFRAPWPEQLGVVGNHAAGMHPAEAVVTVAAPPPRAPSPT